MGYLLAVLRAVTAGFSTIIGKNYMKGTRDVKLNFDIRALLLYPLATIYYLILAKFNVPLNFVTFIYAFIYAIISLAIDWTTMFGYVRATVIYVTIFGSAGATIFMFLYELIFTDETFSFCTLLSIGARMLAVIIPLFFAKKEKSMTLSGFAFCILHAVIASTSGILMRMYVNTPNVMSTSSFCFWVNVFIMPVVMTKILLSVSKNNKDGIKRLIEDAKKIEPKYYILLVVNLCITNLMVLVGFEVIRLIGGTISTIISGSMTMIISFIISVFVYKEEASYQSVISTIISIVAIVLSVF